MPPYAGTLDVNHLYAQPCGHGIRCKSHFAGAVMPNMRVIERIVSLNPSDGLPFTENNVVFHTGDGARVPEGNITCCIKDIRYEDVARAFRERQRHIAIVQEDIIPDRVVLRHMIVGRACDTKGDIALYQAVLRLLVQVVG